jgi:fatty-acyl-CoA synthase
MRTDLSSELIEFSREDIAHYKCPKRVVFVDELPRNEYGKVLKGKLRERFERLYAVLQ